MKKKNIEQLPLQKERETKANKKTMERMRVPG